MTDFDTLADMLNRSGQPFEVRIEPPRHTNRNVYPAGSRWLETGIFEAVFTPDGEIQAFFNIY